MFRFHPLLIAICAVAAYGAADDPLQATFSKMDAVSASFKGLKADMRRVTHLDVISDDTVENGTVLVRRTNPKDLKMLIQISSPPNPLKALITGGKVQVYYPNSNTVQEYELGKAKSLRDKLMTLAFGSSSKDLMAYYKISMGGPDKIGGQSATRIELTPKDKDVAAYFTKIDLWISDATGVTLQQKMYQPGGDYTMATYSNIQLANVPDSAVKLDVPSNAHWERPQK